MLFFDAKELPQTWDREELLGSDTEEDDEETVSLSKFNEILVELALELGKKGFFLFSETSTSNDMSKGFFLL